MIIVFFVLIIYIFYISEVLVFWIGTSLCVLTLWQPLAIQCQRCVSTVDSNQGTPVGQQKATKWRAEFPFFLSVALEW